MRGREARNGRLWIDDHLPAEPRAKYPQPNDESPLNVPIMTAPSLQAQQPIPAGVSGGAVLLPSHSFSVEHRLAMEDEEIDALEDVAERRLKTSRETSCWS